MKKFLLIALVSLASFGCSNDGKQFAATTDRIAGYVSTGLTLVDQQTSTGLMSRDTGAAIVVALRSVNTLNAQVIEEAKRYVDPTTGAINLTADGKVKILDILNSSTQIAVTLTQDDRILKLSQTQRDQILGIIGGINATTSSLIQLVKAAKEKR
jgi:hypothetical protein